MESFTYQGMPGRVVFGPGSIDRARDEIEALGCRHALVLSTPSRAEDARALADRIGPVAAGTFTGATMHTPVAVTEQALRDYRARGADCVVAVGGGSTVGLGKAISRRNGAPQLAIPTTYAGSEATDILGETDGGIKTTMRDPAIRPGTVIYDPDLTVALAVPMSVASALNAMAHAIEGLYAPDANPITSLMAVEGLRALRDALPRVVARPDAIAARSEALYGSWLCGSVLGSVAMSLHHKLCHTLGGAFDLPHAETHAILLPHTTAYNAGAAVERLAPAAALFGGDLAPGLWDFAAGLGAPRALADLGLSLADLETAAELAAQAPYSNPRAITRDGLLGLMTRAHAGARPT